MLILYEFFQKEDGIILYDFVNLNNSLSDKLPEILFKEDLSISM